MLPTKILCSIITIGDELLIGQTIDTNSAWMAREMNHAGFWVHRRVAVGDDFDGIWSTLEEESTKSEIVLITGGLGPTADDITKALLCKYFSGTMQVHEPTLQHIKELFELLKRPLLERNLKQAEVPDNCIVLKNPKGTAPGMWFEKNGVVFVSMPGVPYEMKSIMETAVIEKLLQKFVPQTILHRTMLTAGLGESFIAERLVAFENSLPAHIKLAYLPNYSFVRLRLTAIANDQLFLENEINGYHHQLKELLMDILVVDKDENIEQVVAGLLLQNKQTVSTAESCTGGYIAHCLTSIPGSSAFYNGSVIAYAYEAKENLLNVSHDELLQHGAVSEKIVSQMAAGVLEKLKTEYSIATTGIMGPGGATPDKPVGTVWIAVANNDKIVAKKFFFRYDRIKNIELTALNAFEMLRQLILDSAEQQLQSED
jgi:nicotinamide-nucleotide amidase